MQVSLNARTCPHCGAPRPALRDWNGSGFEWKSEFTVYGYPLVHVAVGRDKTGKLRVAKGIIAIGQFAVGLVTVAQFGVGILFGFGQFIVGSTALAQFAVALVFGAGQIASGYVAIGQIVIGYYGLAQAGLAAHLWSTHHKDPEAARFFADLAEKIGFHVAHWFQQQRRP
jgi:hypothetical protein